MNFFRKIISLFMMIGIFTIFQIGISYSQSFSCPIGTTPTCLDYGTKLCSSSGKCVDSSAKCFSSMTCFGGFVCQSDYDECSNKYNFLVNDYNDLIYKIKRLRNTHNDIIDCVSSAFDITSAKNCVY